jgi:hypothetical protein
MNIWRRKELGHHGERRTTAGHSVHAPGELRKIARVQAIYRLPTQHPHNIIEIAGVTRSKSVCRPALSSIRELSSPVQSVTGRHINILTISLLENEHV